MDDEERFKEFVARRRETAHGSSGERSSMDSEEDIRSSSMDSEDSSSMDSEEDIRTVHTERGQNESPIESVQNDEAKRHSREQRTFSIFFPVGDENLVPCAPQYAPLGEQKTKSSLLWKPYAGRDPQTCKAGEVDMLNDVIAYILVENGGPVSAEEIKGRIRRNLDYGVVDILRDIFESRGISMVILDLDSVPNSEESRLRRIHAEDLRAGEAFLLLLADGTFAIAYPHSDEKFRIIQKIDGKETKNVVRKMIFLSSKESGYQAYRLQKNSPQRHRLPSFFSGNISQTEDRNHLYHFANRKPGQPYADEKEKHKRAAEHLCFSTEVASRPRRDRRNQNLRQHDPSFNRRTAASTMHTRDDESYGSCSELD